MAGGAETPNIAAPPAIARLGADRKCRQSPGVQLAGLADVRRTPTFFGSLPYFQARLQHRPLLVYALISKQSRPIKAKLDVDRYFSELRAQLEM